MIGHSVYMITTLHPLYDAVLELRQRELRQPLGLNLYDENLEPEKEQTIFVYEDGGRVLGCGLLQHVDGATFKLRQMAVDRSVQGKGIGSAIMQAAELFAIKAGKHKILLHARKHAEQFYARNGYTSVGETFTEVGIPHIEMQKDLREN